MKRVLTGWVSIFLLTWVVSGCTTTPPTTMPNLDYSFRLLISAVTHALPNGVASQSSNSREWVSRYFIYEGGRVASKPPTDDTPRRYQVQVWILGDRRPYKIRIEAWEERHDYRGEPGYSRIGQSEEVAEVVANQIDEYLVKSRDSRDLIDDFRAF